MEALACEHLNLEREWLEKMKMQLAKKQEDLTRIQAENNNFGN